MSYDSEVLADAPTAYWPFGEAAGATSVVDVVGGISVPASGSPLTGKPNPVGTAMDTNAGTSHFLLTVTPTTLNWVLNSDLTIEFTIQRDNTVATTYAIIGNRTSPTVNGHFAVFLLAGGLGCDVTSSASRWTSPYLMADVNWHHICFTHVGATGLRSLYVDGVLNSQASVKPTSANGTPGSLTLGAMSGTVPIPGRLSNIAVYNGKALTAGRVLAHYKEFLIAKSNTGFFAG